MQQFFSFLQRVKLKNGKEEKGEERRQGRIPATRDDSGSGAARKATEASLPHIYDSLSQRPDTRRQAVKAAQSLAVQVSRVLPHEQTRARRQCDRSYRCADDRTNDEPPTNRGGDGTWGGRASSVVRRRRRRPLPSLSRLVLVQRERLVAVGRVIGQSLRQDETTVDRPRANSSSGRAAANLSPTQKSSIGGPTAAVCAVCVRRSIGSA
uniref:Uncharacterized protein n=1 Tax=Plectus sambesii TaxID=2011161 RepID=A0A914XC31_9BILA